MKIGTISLNINTDDLNYGAMLHSWAFIEFLRQYEKIDSCEIIDYITPRLETFDGRHPVLSAFREKRLRTFLRCLISFKPYQRRRHKFQSFISNNMHVSDTHYTRKTLNDAKLDYDCVIAESDVIWSPQFFGGKFDESFFLALDSMQNMRKIAYSASTANAEFEKYGIDQFKSLLKYPDYISCRECYGTQIIHACEREDAVTVIDPVLLLQAKDYEKIMAKRLLPEKYLLVYIPVGYNNSYVKAAREYAEKNGLKIVEISFHWFNRHTVMGDAGIEEFLSLIYHADMIFTNSFHAVCFCCLFHKEFYAFERQTGRKTEDLCQRLALTGCYMDVSQFREHPPIDFKKVDEKLNAERKKSIAWLENALGKEVQK